MGVRDWWAGLQQRYDALVKLYGAVAITTYFTIFFGTWFSFWVAIRAGYQADTVAQFGTVGLAWALTKATQPLRIGVSLILTPFLGKAWQRFRGQAPTDPPTN